MNTVSTVDAYFAEWTPGFLPFFGSPSGSVLWSQMDIEIPAFGSGNYDVSLIPNLMTDQQMRLIQELTDLRVPDRTFRVWRVSTGDWFVIDQVFGKDDTVYYALGISPDEWLASLATLLNK